MNGNSRLAPVFISQSHLYYTFGMQMSITVGILDLSVCPNEAPVNGFLSLLIGSFEERQKYVDKNQDDNLNELKLQIFHFRFAD